MSHSKKVIQDKDDLPNLLRELWGVCTKYMKISIWAPLVALLVSVFIYNSYNLNNLNIQGDRISFYSIILKIPKCFSFLINNPTTSMHAVALLFSLWAQIAVAIFYDKWDHFSCIKFRNKTINSIGFLVPVFSTSFVIASLSSNTHLIQMIFNYAYLIVIVIWDFTYWQHTNCIETTDSKIKLRFKRCIENSKSIFISDMAVLLSFIFIHIILLSLRLANRLDKEQSHLFEAGAFGAILFFSAFLLINDLREWHEKEGVEKIENSNC
jgi:hypothetical protein